MPCVPMINRCLEILAFTRSRPLVPCELIIMKCPAHEHAQRLLHDCPDLPFQICWALIQFDRDWYITQASHDEHLSEYPMHVIKRL